MKRKRQSAKQALVQSRKRACDIYTTNSDVRRNYRDGFTEGWFAREVWERNERGLEEADVFSRTVPMTPTEAKVAKRGRV